MTPRTASGQANFFGFSCREKVGKSLALVLKYYAQNNTRLKLDAHSALSVV